jgi:hypothetical protein
VNRRAIVIGCLCIAAWSGAHAHGGGLNAEGCHNNRKTGDYHCHRAPAVIAQSGVQQKSDAVPNKVAALPQAPTCHTGPRGGRYTITKSGKKNYKGC